MKKEWFFDKLCGATVAVYAEDGKIVEVGVESPRFEETLGNVYKGRVANVIPGMRAAFVACGMERNCYLPLDEGAPQISAYDGTGTPDVLSLKEGDEILVQVVKPPRGNKGAKVTCDLSFVGKTLIYLPKTDFLGISRKITEPALRESLLKEADKLRGKGEGFIVRTAAAEATRRRLKTESEYLKRIHRATLESAKNAPVGSIVYREHDLPVKIMRDSLGGGVNRIVVGERGLYERMLHLAAMRADLGEKKIVLYEGERTLFSHFGLSEQIHALADPQVSLGNGGYLVIDPTEAMTVIDVNTGKYTGDSDLENTVFDTNLLAAREIARQVRLRNIGGIVAVDFIDMEEEEHRAAVDAELARALAEDRAKCRCHPMSELCVALFTRKRTGSELRSFLLQPCKTCTRQGYVLSDRYMAVRIRSAVFDLFGKGYSSAIVEVHPDVLHAVLSGRYFSEDIAESWAEKRVYFVPRPEFVHEKFTVRGDNARVLTLPDTAQIAY